jgi:hypothetical protein
MNDLLLRSRNVRSNNKKYSSIEILCIVVMKSRSKSNKEISKVIEHSENSIVYKYNRWMKKFSSMNELLIEINMNDKSIEEIENLVDEYILSKS